MGQLRDDMIRYMNIRGYSPKTIELYTSCVRVFSQHFNKSPLEISSNEVESFFLHLREIDRKDSTLRMYYEAMKFFYRMHKTDDRLPKIRFKKEQYHHPIILEPAQVASLLNHCGNLQNRLILTLMYSAGLRISEALNLRIEDIDFHRMVINVRSGKNGKDRCTILAEGAADLLKVFIERNRPRGLLFLAKDNIHAASPETVSRNFKKLLRDQGLDESLRMHTLRHCFATHLIENGVSVFHVMNLLGHAHIQTTMIYLHMKSPASLGIKSPLDHIDMKSLVLNRPYAPQLELISA